MKPFKILHVVGAMNRGGTETFLMNIYRNINRERVQFDFISYSTGEADYDQEIIALGGKIIKLSSTNSIKELYDVLKNRGPYDAVHAHTLFHCGMACIAARLAGVKIIVTHAHTTNDSNGGLLRNSYMSLMRFAIMRLSTNLLACSQAAGRYLYGKKGVKRDTYTYFPNAIDYKVFLQNNTKEVRKFKVEKGIGKNLIIGHIGRFKESKNHMFLLDILKRLLAKDTAVTLLLVGDGELREQVENRAMQDGLSAHIRFVGVRDDITNMLNSMDVFVFPSLYEGLGLVLLEAQACGIPCVVSEAIQPEADLNLGLVSKLALRDGSEAWTHRILQLAGRKEVNKATIADGFERNGYSLSQSISKLMKIYQTSGGNGHEEYIDRLL